MEAELNRELRRLQVKYRSGFDITKVIWEPKAPELCMTNDLVEGGHVRGECKNDPINLSRWVIVIYEQYDRDMAIHTVHHEFIEHIITKPNRTFVELSNTLLKLLNKLQYEDQEDIVETFAKMEDVEYDEIARRDKKH